MWEGSDTETGLASDGDLNVQAIVVEPSRDAPESVRRISQPNKLCIMFYGPAANKVPLLPYLCFRQPSRLHILGSARPSSRCQ